MNDMIPGGISALAGLEMEGIPIATLLSQKSNYQHFSLEKKPKNMVHAS